MPAQHITKSTDRRDCGKHKGKMWKDLTIQYQNWAVDSGAVILHDKLLQQLKSDTIYLKELRLSNRTKKSSSNVIKCDPESIFQ